MQSQDIYSLFEQCLARLNAGEDLEAILAGFPDQAAQLRPLLTAAEKARRSGAPLRIPASAQIDSRTRFLLEAERMQRKPQGFKPHMRLAGAVTMAAFVLLAGIFGTGLVSAKAVPGQVLYPVKRVVEQAQLALTVDQSARLSLEEEFDQRRVKETEKLSQTGRSESVTLAGPLENIDQTWRVGGVKLNLTQDQEAIAHSLSGSYVEVKGEVHGEEGLEVEDMELRLFTISGILEEMSDTEWLVSGVKVLVMENTQITGKPKIGKKVELTTLHYNEEYFLALSVRVSGAGGSLNKPEGENNGKGLATATELTADSETEQLDSLAITPENPKPVEVKETHKPELTKLQETGEKPEETVTPQPTKKVELTDDDDDD